MRKKIVHLDPEVGRILISEPFLLDSYFKRAVILLGEHSEEGTVGFILNKPTDLLLNDALEDFPDRAERLKTSSGLAILIKTDVFKRLMYYTYAEDRGKLYAIHVDQIWEALDMIKAGKAPGSLEDILAMAPQADNDELDEIEPDFENVHDVIQLPMEQRKKKKKKNKRNRDRSQSAAAAVEKAAQNDTVQNRNHPPRRDDRNRRPDNRPPQGKPENRPPQGKPEQRPPQARDSAKPPQPPRTDAPRDENKSSAAPNQQQGGANRNRDKRRFKGRGPKKD